MTKQERIKELEAKAEKIKIEREHILSDIAKLKEKMEDLELKQDELHAQMWNIGIDIHRLKCVSCGTKCIND